MFDGCRESWEAETPDPLSAARGVVYGIAIAVCLWVGAFVAYAVFA